MTFMRKNRAIAILTAVFITGYVASAAVAEPTMKDAYNLCKGGNENCKEISGNRSNPHSSHGCDFSLEYGYIDVKKWKKCHEWCDARFLQCNADVKQAFE